MLRRHAILWGFAALAVLLPVGTARCATFNAGRYQTKDGALLLNSGGDFVEPYFACKALIVAQDSGLDVRPAAEAWIAWMLPRQRSDGRLDRFCRKSNQWKRCGQADADDSLLSLWLQLLYRMSPPEGLRPQWQNSASLAEAQLLALRRNRLHVYSVSRQNHVALLMDNVEVYAALREMAAAETRFGDAAHARMLTQRADDLRSGIEHTFWDARHHIFRASSQKSGVWHFYPEAVAQVYVLLAGLPDPNGDLATAWAQWYRAYGSAWLARHADPHPWGLVAVAANLADDKSAASCWLDRSASLRHSPVWNLLEEAAFQALAAKLPADAGSCTEVRGGL